MIDHDRPVVQADSHVCQGDIALGPFRQLFKAAAKVVAKQPQRATLEGQGRIRRAGQAHLIKRLLEQTQRAGVRVNTVNQGIRAMGHQRRARVGHQNVKATVRMIRMAGVQQHCPGEMAYWREPEFCGVRAPG